MSEKSSYNSYTSTSRHKFRQARGSKQRTRRETHLQRREARLEFRSSSIQIDVKFFKWFLQKLAEVKKSTAKIHAVVMVLN